MTEIRVKHDERAVGRSKYNFYRLIRLNFDLMTGFSMLPLQMMSFFGFGVSIVSLAFAAFLLIRRLIVGPEVEGVFTLFAILFAVVGLLFMGLGLLGEYVARIYSEVRRRPRTSSGTASGAPSDTRRPAAAGAGPSASLGIDDPAAGARDRARGSLSAVALPPQGCRFRCNRADPGITSCLPVRRASV
jgi:hypothetical protein